MLDFFWPLIFYLKSEICIPLFIEKEHLSTILTVTSLERWLSLEQIYNLCVYDQSTSHDNKFNQTAPVEVINLQNQID